MNKKNLSVVMAGAMLATSVAPVLAATNTSLPGSISESHKALLKTGIEKLMDSEKVVDATGDTRLDGMVPASNGNEESIYGVEVIGKDGMVKSTLSYDKDTATGYIDNIKEGDKVKIYTREHNEFLGLNVLATLPTVNPGSSTMYQNTDIENIAKIINDPSGHGVSTPDTTYPGLISAVSNHLNDYIKEKSAVVTTSEDGVKKSVTFKLKANNDITGESYRTVTLTAGDESLDFNMPLGKTEEGKDLLLAKPINDGSNYATDLQKAYGFAKKVTYTAGTKLTGDKKDLTQEIEVTAATATGDTNDSYLASDLYDGFTLTAKGTEISDLINNDKYTIKYEVNGTDKTSTIASNPDSVIVLDKTTGICNLTIKIQSAKNNTLRTIEVYSTNAKEMQSLYKLINGDYNVGIIGGSNRYETAVNVAEAQGVKKAGTANGTDTTANIVLVNGESLVDGLAAAPFAAAVNGTSKIAAPVLLSKKDTLPKETKEYLEKLVLDGDLTPTQKKAVTINLVGGTGVLGTSLEKELKDMGFTVKRFGGDDREETSIAVAKEIKTISSTVKDVFVVGGNGEADAMSIASVASTTDTLANKTESTVRPIIVSSVHGVSDSAASYIANLASTDGSVTIVGGTNVVSTDDEVKIDELLNVGVNGGNGSERIAGDNRFETNAKIIDTYYKSQASKAVVMVKDGMANKSELVDALSAANYAASKKAPIVLASKEVKDTQKTSLLGISKSSVKKVVQVGQGAERTVLETIADLFGVSNL